MLETTLVALQDITLEKIFDESGRKALYDDFAKLMQQVVFFPRTSLMLSERCREIGVSQIALFLEIGILSLSVWFLGFSGIRLLAWRHLHVDNGAAHLLRPGHCLESPIRR